MLQNSSGRVMRARAPRIRQGKKFIYLCPLSKSWAAHLTPLVRRRTLPIIMAESYIGECRGSMVVLGWAVGSFGRSGACKEEWV